MTPCRLNRIHFRRRCRRRSLWRDRVDDAFGAPSSQRALEPTAHLADILRRSGADATADAMDIPDLIALASPPCHECGAPVQRVEARWHLDEDSRWRPGPYFMVCAERHRVLVEALE